MADQTATECEFARLLPDGAVVVGARGEEWTVQIEGIEVPRPLPAGYVRIFDRIARLGRPLRCTILGELECGRRLAKLSYYGWQDKSGDVWLDLATVLVEEGVAWPRPPEQLQP
jgi:hypothetical protein